MTHGLRWIVGALAIGAAATGALADPAPATMATAAEKRLQHLQQFRTRPKYAPDALYTGVHDAAQRQRFVARLDALAEELTPLAAVSNPKPALLRALERAWTTFELADTEDRERTLAYFEQLMEIFGVESSDGLLNRLMYGFDPTLPAQTRDAQAWAAMSDADRTIATHLQGMPASAAEAELRRRLGPPLVNLPETVAWSLDGSTDRLVSISRAAGKAYLIWTVRGQAWVRELTEQ